MTKAIIETVDDSIVHITFKDTEDKSKLPISLFIDRDMFVVSPNREEPPNGYNLNLNIRVDEVELS